METKYLTPAHTVMMKNLYQTGMVFKPDSPAQNTLKTLIDLGFVDCHIDDTYFASGSGGSTLDKGIGGIGGNGMGGGEPQGQNGIFGGIAPPL